MIDIAPKSNKNRINSYDSALGHIRRFPLTWGKQVQVSNILLAVSHANQRSCKENEKTAQTC